MGLVRMAARTAVVAGTATAVSGRVAASSGRQVCRAGRAAVRSSRRRRRSRRRRPEDDATAQLQNLAQLHTQGVLTDEEFAAAKAKILGI